MQLKFYLKASLGSYGVILLQDTLHTDFDANDFDKFMQMIYLAANHWLTLAPTRRRPTFWEPGFYSENKRRCELFSQYLH